MMIARTTRAKCLLILLSTLAFTATGCSIRSNIGENDDAGVVDAQLPMGAYDECGNGMDDDGDGQIDEDCYCGRGETQRCFNGRYPNRAIGICSDGVQSCDLDGSMEFGRWGACEGDTLPAGEICGDGIDNDCDAAIDDGCACTEGQTWSCGEDFATGTCERGMQVCLADGTRSDCQGSIGPAAELCGDGLDNDCDGLADEGCGCVPEPEVCGDGLDNDCDGEVDEPACGSECAGGERVVDLSYRGNTMCAMTADGRVFCWGGNTRGALGAGDDPRIESAVTLSGTTLTYSTSALQVLGAAGATSLNTTDYRWASNCITTAEGVECWGIPNTSSVGIPAVPRQLSSIGGQAVQFQGNDEHGYVRTLDGSIWTWNGWTAGGAPAQVAIENVVELSYAGAGGSFLRADGSVWFMALDMDGIEVPEEIGGLSQITSIQATHDTACGLDNAGEVYCWGTGALRNPEHVQAVAGRVPGLSSVRRLIVGDVGFCSIKYDGSLWCWSPAIDFSDESSHPWQVTEVQDVVDVAFERFPDPDPVNRAGQMCVLSGCGLVQCWGDGYVGRTGDGTALNSRHRAPSTVPQQVVGLP